MPEKKDFSISSFIDSPKLKKRVELTDPITNKLLKLNKISDLYSLADEESSNAVEFAEAIIKNLNIKLKVNFLSEIPKEGPVVFISNHPFGAIDGIILAAVLGKARPDLKIMVTRALGVIEPLDDLFLYVDNWTTGNAKNITALKNTIKWLRAENSLCIFPAGEVSHFDFKERQVIDPKWNNHFTQIIKRSNATVVPIFFEGNNSLMFQFAGIIHPALRTVMLPREFMKKRSKTIKMIIGHPILHEKLELFERKQELSEFLRIKTYQLSDFIDDENKNQLKKLDTIIPAVSREAIEEEIVHLPDTDCVYSYKSFDVYVSDYKNIPNIHREIGRLREETFRLVNEGTGRNIDIDEFDTWYKHLFVWDKEGREILGAYRIGEANKILEERGKKALYTSTLFKYRSSFIRNIPPSLELGRSFIQKKYQRNHHSLLLLWKGITHFVSANRKYRILFGPVSISNDFAIHSKSALKAFLEESSLTSIKPKAPFKPKVSRGFKHYMEQQSKSDLETLSQIINKFERDGKDMPILLKHYLKLGGHIVSFNVDKEFMDVLDGLIVLDIVDIPKKNLQTYMGKESAEKYMDYHRGI
jgi:putative hemolysin